MKKKNSFVYTLINDAINENELITNNYFNQLRGKLSSDYNDDTLRIKNNVIKKGSLAKAIDAQLKYVSKGSTILVGGKNWKLEKYVARQVRDSVKDLAKDSTLARMKDFDLDIIIFSTHAGAREDCDNDQGKAFSMSGASGIAIDFNGNEIEFEDISNSSYGEVAGIMGVNCRHQMYPLTYDYIKE
jgi:hypothetical protein